MNIYLFFFEMNCFILILCIFLPFIDRNQFFGFRINATLSDPEIWKKSNIRASKLIGSIAILFALINGLFYINNYPKKYAKIVEAIFFLFLILIIFYLTYYANSLYEEKFPEKIKKKEPFKSSNLNKLWNFVRKLNPFYVVLKDLWI